MNGTQYANIIKHTLKRLPEDLKGDSVGTVKEIFRNCGIEFYKGSLNEVKEVLETNDYMSWEICEAEDVKDLADNGVAVVGIKDDEIFIVAPEAHLELEEGHENIRTISELDEDTIDGIVFFAATKTTTYTEPPKPHGNYLTFTSNGRVNVCTDGSGLGHDDENHQSQTKYLNGYLNADTCNYIVIPGDVYRAKTNLLGCVGVTKRNNGKYVFGLVADIGPDTKEGKTPAVDEFSVAMVNNLGFDTDGGNWVSDEKNVTTYIFTNAKYDEDTWRSAANISSGYLNNAIKHLGEKYYY